MKEKIIRLSCIFFMLFVIGAGALYFIAESNAGEQNLGEEKVLLNRIEKEKGSKKSVGDLKEYLEETGKHKEQGTIKKIVIWFVVLAACYVLITFSYIYKKILQPFEKLEKYAEDVAAGNLDVELQYERTNYFGAFTWAFDHMREEIKYAKKKEKEAIEENKTVIASLSHDIKTPIASIRAYSEALEAGIDADFETRQRYLETIMKKCDEVTNLINDLVLHSLSELEKLEIVISEVDMAKVVRETVLELGFPNLNLVEPVTESVVWADEKRVAQILENLLNNARKYAPEAEVFISTEIIQQKYYVHVRDTGKGIHPEDIPFVMQKFYRGHNVGNQPGSGLGLYIVKYLVDEMKGNVEICNSESGLDVVFCLPIK